MFSPSLHYCIGHLGHSTSVVGSRGARYQVQVAGGQGGGPVWTCSCPSFTHRGGVCKHIKSVQAARDGFCGWDARLDAGAPTESGRCPRCAGPVAELVGVYRITDDRVRPWIGDPEAVRPEVSAALSAGATGAVFQALGAAGIAMASDGEGFLGPEDFAYLVADANYLSGGWFGDLLTGRRRGARVSLDLWKGDQRVVDLEAELEGDFVEHHEFLTGLNEYLEEVDAAGRFYDLDAVPCGQEFTWAYLTRAEAATLCAGGFGVTEY